MRHLIRCSVLAMALTVLLGSHSFAVTYEIAGTVTGLKRSRPLPENTEFFGVLTYSLDPAGGSAFSVTVPGVRLPAYYDPHAATVEDSRVEISETHMRLSGVALEWPQSIPPIYAVLESRVSIRFEDTDGIVFAGAQRPLEIDLADLEYAGLVMEYLSEDDEGASKYFYLTADIESMTLIPESSTIPEPSTLMMLAMAGGVLLVKRRRLVGYSPPTTAS